MRRQPAAWPRAAAATAPLQVVLASTKHAQDPQTLEPVGTWPAARMAAVGATTRHGCGRWRRAVVETFGNLRDLHTQLSGLQWRRHRRPDGDRAASRLS